MAAKPETFGGGDGGDGDDGDDGDGKALSLSGIITGSGK